MLVSTENKDAKNRDDTQNFTFIQCGHESDGTYVFNVQCWNYHRAYMFMFKKTKKTRIYSGFSVINTGSNVSIRAQIYAYFCLNRLISGSDGSRVFFFYLTK